ncbi:hypothetical protein [Demequina muriae]|uniref:Uncharacterized protein n=1 Tax=Demequina muriae TaxID=3051664 RepID=A0ABT8GEQ3_9MICO|nr:hypothetical protein [Demequina sp. EGI L300058]MDN4479913.1 hypothetical protein [Demequina sp. EGI L300058]
MTRDEALSAILARPENHLGSAVAHACYESVLALQEAGASDAEKVAAISEFAAAKRYLLAESADLALLP